MKMKKLTALALAGVLCLGMSTTAFAEEITNPDEVVSDGSDSNTGDDGDQTIDDVKADIAFSTSNKTDPATGGNKVTVTSKGTIPADCKEWVNPDNPNDASDAIKASLNEALENVTKTLKDGTYQQKDEGTIKDKKAMLESLDLGKDSYYEVITLDDLDYAFEDGEQVTVRFKLDATKLPKDKKVKLLHQVTIGDTVAWEVFEYDVLEHKGENGALEYYYVEHPFTDFSPVAILKVRSDGTIDPEIPDPDNKPGENPENPALTPDANGNITVDQLADLLAKKLQQNLKGTTVVRSAVSGKASPKTGE